MGVIHDDINASSTNYSIESRSKGIQIIHVNGASLDSFTPKFLLP